MKQEIRPRCFEIRFWNPGIHKEIKGTVALFCLTQQEDLSITPEMILGCVYTELSVHGQTAFFLTWETFPVFFRKNPKVTFCVYDIGKTLAALAGAFEDPMELYGTVDEKRFIDVHIMSRLVGLAFEGNSTPFSSVVDCLSFTGIKMIKKNLHDFCSSPPDVDKFLKVPTSIPPQDRNMMLRAAKAIYQLHIQLRNMDYFIPDTSDVAAHFGLPDDPEWQRNCEEKFGILTHDIQAWADIVYTDIYRTGLHINSKRVCRLIEQEETKLVDLTQQMEEYGYEHNPEYLFCDEEEVRRVLESYGEENDISFTVKGDKISLATAELEPFADEFGFIPLYLQAKELERRFIPLEKMDKPQLHPQYSILATTGRVYASGDLAIQTLPREGGIRECIIPSPGHALVIVDYVMLELVMLAQALISQFGYKSELAKMINAGGDIHRKVAAMIFQKKEKAVTTEERNHAKVLNFGIPGGLGTKGLCKHAKQKFGLDWDETTASRMRKQWLYLFPEAQRFLTKNEGEQIGVWVGTGRFRWTTRYTELRNTVFQGLGADGVNLALKRLWLHDYRIVTVIHDEVLIEVPEADDYTDVVADIEHLMIEGMQQVAPDMLVRVESAVSTCWSKKATKVHDKQGRLVAWSPVRKTPPKPARRNRSKNPPRQPRESPRGSDR